MNRREFLKFTGLSAIASIAVGVTAREAMNNSQTGHMPQPKRLIAGDNIRIDVDEDMITFDIPGEDCTYIYYDGHWKLLNGP